MPAFQTVVVGTDGSDSSFLAVDRAAALAGDSGATLVIACAYHPASQDQVDSATDQLGSDVAYQVVGANPAEDTVRAAADRARKAARATSRPSSSTVSRFRRCSTWCASNPRTCSWSATAA